MLYTFSRAHYSETDLQRYLTDITENDAVVLWQDGVSNGNGLVYPANDEFNLTQAWQAFSTQHRIPLHLCVAASQRRGVVDALTAKETDKTNLAEGFEITGLGEFMAMALKADRVVTL